MNTLPQIPETAPFSPEQRAWLNGFLAGLFNRPVSSSQLSAPSSQLTPLTILYASQTGTSESLAKQAAKEAGKRGFAPAVLDMATVSADQLPTHANLLVITSTYGDGEPPDSAKSLHATLREGTHALAPVRYSVCALGDTNYTLFCQAGKDFDTYLEKHGAVRIAPRTDCDVDYETSFATWLDTTLTALGSQVERVVPNALSESAPPTPSLTPRKTLTPPPSSPSVTSTPPAPPKRSTTSNSTSPAPASFTKRATPSA